MCRWERNEEVGPSMSIEGHLGPHSGKMAVQETRFPGPVSSV